MGRKIKNAVAFLIEESFDEEKQGNGVWRMRHGQTKSDKKD